MPDDLNPLGKREFQCAGGLSVRKESAQGPRPDPVATDTSIHSSFTRFSALSSSPITLALCVVAGADRRVKANNYQPSAIHCAAASALQKEKV
jgi:hypothetical protein